MKRREVIGAAMLAASTTWVTPISAQQFPTKPIRIVLGFPPGGSNDAFARLLGVKLAERLGQPVIIDTRPGASGIIASEHVAASAPDGHTLMLIATSHTANPSLYRLKYDTEKAFTPIAQLGAGAYMMVVPPGSPARNMKELIEQARANPGKLTMPHGGVGTFQHMVSAMLLSMTGMDVLLVPYKGGGPALTDIVGGNSHMSLNALAHYPVYVPSGKLRALGVTSRERVAAYPDLPAIAETVPGYEAESWWGIVGPAGMPRAVVDRLSNEITAACNSPEMLEMFRKEGGRPIKRTGADFGKYLSSEIAKWANVVKDGKIKVEPV
jgi:tripartite-type tricarboxylate transporter receptor subunit TctC